MLRNNRAIVAEALSYVRSYRRYRTVLDSKGKWEALNYFGLGENCYSNNRNYYD